MTPRLRGRGSSGVTFTARSPGTGRRGGALRRRGRAGARSPSDSPGSFGARPRLGDPRGEHEVLAQRVALEAVRQQQRVELGVAVEGDAEHLGGLALVPGGAGEDARPATAPGVLARAAGAQQQRRAAAPATRAAATTSKPVVALVDGRAAGRRTSSPELVAHRGHGAPPTGRAGRRRRRSTYAVERAHPVAEQLGGRGRPVLGHRAGHAAICAAAAAAVQQRLRPGRAAGHVDVDRDQLVDALGDAVAVPVRPAGVRAGAERR